MDKRLTESRKAEDLKVMRETMRWPCWPLLPVKRFRQGETQCGYLVDRGKEPWAEVVLGNVFELNELTRGQIAALPRLRYSGVAEFFADGWVVD